MEGTTVGCGTVVGLNVPVADRSGFERTFWVRPGGGLDERRRGFVASAGRVGPEEDVGGDYGGLGVTLEGTTVGGGTEVGVFTTGGPTRRMCSPRERFSATGSATRARERLPATYGAHVQVQARRITSGTGNA